MKTFKFIVKWAVLFFAAMGIVFFALWWLNSPQDLAENSLSMARLNQADYAVDTIDLDIIDSSRDTPALGGYKGDDKRTLHGVIWFPKGQTSAHPLIIYSHGFAGYHKESSHIAKYLASNGYVVAAVDFPLSYKGSPADVPQLLDIVNQPGDVSAVIDHVLALNKDSDSVMHQRIDTDNIGAMGLSLGGLTTALVSFHPDLNDQRIKAAVMMAPPLEAFSQQFYATNPEVKSLLISGTLDRVVPEPANASDVIDRNLAGWFISMDKGTHLGFADVGNPLRWMENPDNLGCAFMGYALPKLDLPERWDAVIPNTGGVIRDIVVGSPCPELAGQSMNGLKQQWLTRIAIGSFFDMHLHSGHRAEMAKQFLIDKLRAENPEISLRSPL